MWERFDGQIISNKNVNYKIINKSWDSEEF